MILTPLHPDVSLFTFGEGDSPFEQPTSVLAVRGRRRAFVVDTHCGPLSMEPVRECLRRECTGLPLTVFNTHWDWDHVWGNCAFPEGEIVAHEATRRLLETHGSAALQEMSAFRHGDVRLVLPDRTFAERLDYPDDGVCMMHLPGHTEDSSVFFHQASGVLFVGDLVEDPIPWLGWTDIPRYLASLERILAWPARWIVCSHSGIVSRELVRANRAYLQDLAAGREARLSGEAARAIHDENRKTLLRQQVPMMPTDPP